MTFADTATAVTLNRPSPAALTAFLKPTPSPSTPLRDPETLGAQAWLHEVGVDAQSRPGYLVKLPQDTLALQDRVRAAHALGLKSKQITSRGSLAGELAKFDFSRFIVAIWNVPPVPLGER
jgi:hypothetical protein